MDLNLYNLSRINNLGSTVSQPMMRSHLYNQVPLIDYTLNKSHTSNNILALDESIDFKISNQIHDSKLKLEPDFQDIDFAEIETKSQRVNHKKTLVLDLDETLVHSAVELEDGYDFEVKARGYRR